MRTNYTFQRYITDVGTKCMRTGQCNYPRSSASTDAATATLSYWLSLIRDRKYLLTDNTTITSSNPDTTASLCVYIKTNAS